MKRWHTIGVITGLCVVAAGCGFNRPQAITHNTKPKTVERELLARMADWHDVQATVSEAMGPPAHHPKTLEYQVTSDLTAGQYLIKISQPSPIAIYVNGHETIWYPENTQHYSVLPALPPADQPLEVIAQLPELIRTSQLKSVAVKGNVVTLKMSAAFPTSKDHATMTLAYNSKTNTPLKWTGVWGHTSVGEVFSHFQINPSLAPSALSFSAPTGVTPEIALSPTGTALNIAKSEVDFPIALPPASANMTLDAVNTGSDTAGHRVVIMTFTAPDSSTVVLTEKSTTHSVPTLPGKGLTTTDETVGSLTTAVASLPDNIEEAALIDHKTAVIVEGDTSTVDTLLNDWGSQPSLSPAS
jgi:outer membrane lipoprotein-sorting protein